MLARLLRWPSCDPSSHLRSIFSAQAMHRRGEINTLDTSPPTVPCAPGARSFDRGAFHKSVSVLAARMPASRTGQILKAEQMRGALMNLPKVRSVVPVTDNPQVDEKLVLLRVTDPDDLKPEARQYLEQQNINLVKHTLDFDYDYWTADEIMQVVLPEELRATSPTGFAITGHLAHLNLNDEYLPYKYIIGQLVMDKNKRVRTVVNKLDKINTQFRFFEMELIAGEPDYIVEHHESDCRFTFDFTKVYWNSRLHTEHERLVKQFEPSDGIVADVFAGVGPFAVPAGKKGCAVFANDLNPDSATWLRQNVEANQVGSNVRVSCQDGREFIQTVFAKALAEPFPPSAGVKSSKRQAKEERRRRQQGQFEAAPVEPSQSALMAPPRNTISHVVMNLPDSAITFLDAFRGVLSRDLHGRDLSGIYQTTPMVHCHCFTRYLDAAAAEADVRRRVEEALGSALGDEVALYMVRSVAPNKDMYCISFRLPRDVVFG